MQRLLVLLHVVAVVQDRIPERRKQEDQTGSVECSQWELSEESGRASGNHRLNNLVRRKLSLNLRIIKKHTKQLHYSIELRLEALRSDKSDDLGN